MNQRVIFVASWFVLTTFKIQTLGTRKLKFKIRKERIGVVAAQDGRKEAGGTRTAEKETARWGKNDTRGTCLRAEVEKPT